MADIYSAISSPNCPIYSGRNVSSQNSIPQRSNYENQMTKRYDILNSNYELAKTPDPIPMNYYHSNRCETDMSSDRYVYDVNYLCQMIMEGKWQRAIRILKVEPDLAQFKVKVYKFIGCDKDSYVLPLHLALLEEKVPISLLKALLQAYPNGIRVCETACKRNCLHIIVQSPGSSDSVISYLIQLNPMLCLGLDRLGRLPIHYAIYYSRSFSMLKELLHVCSNTVKAVDIHGWTPLHVASQMNTPPEVIRYLLKISPEMVFQRTSGGSTPYGIAALNHRKLTKVILAKMEHDLNKLPLLCNYDRAVEASKYSKGHFLHPQHSHYVV